MHKRTRYTLLGVVLVLCALGAALYLRQKAPPEVARLLPESDAIVFVNLAPIRAATHFDRSSVTRSPSYQHFIDSTGIVVERDLDRVAFALHRRDDPKGPNGPVAFSEVAEGRFDAPRLAAYLASLSTNQETYAGRTIYAIPSEGRTLRVAILGYDMVAASNMPTAEQIHSILDRQRAAASPFAGSSLLAARFRDVPAFSLAWAVGQLGMPFVERGHIEINGLALPLPPDTNFVASLRFTTALHLRVDAIAASDTEAIQTTQTLSALLNLFRSLERAQQPAPRTPQETAMRELIDSIQIEHRSQRATLTATIPSESLKQLSTR